MLIYIYNILVLFFVNLIMAVSLNFIIGYAGIFQIAHAAFFGVGAYAGALVALHYTPELLPILAVAMLICAALSFVVSLPSLRVRGEYFVAASLGLQVLATTVFTEWGSLTGGLSGLAGIPLAEIFGFEIASPGEFVILAGACAAIVFALTRALVRSSFGRNLKAIRDDEVACAAYGKNVALIKTTAVAVASGFAGVAGALYALFISYVNPESSTAELTIAILAMIVIGGIGTMAGPVIGTLAITALPPLLSFLSLPDESLGIWQQIIFGTFMVLMMMFRPGGIVGRRSRNLTWTR